MHAIRNTLGFVVAVSLAMTVPHYRASAEERQATGSAPAARTLPTLVGTWRVSFTRPPSTRVRSGYIHLGRHLGSYHRSLAQYEPVTRGLAADQ
jgi:hypothetical protein